MNGKEGKGLTRCRTSYWIGLSFAIHLIKRGRAEVRIKERRKREEGEREREDKWREGRMNLEAKES